MDKGDWISIFVPIAFAILLALIPYLWKRRQVKRMVKQFLEATGLLEEEKWVEQYLKIKKRTDKIIFDIDNAVRLKLPALKFQAFRRAVNELPTLLQKLNALPLPKNDQTRQAFTYFVSGISTYLIACQHFLKSMEQNDEESAKEGARQVEIACKLMDKSFQLSSGLN